MYDRNAMDNVNLWLEENKAKNAEKTKNNEIDCESLDGDWETPAKTHAKPIKIVSTLNAQKTTKMQAVNNDGWYEDSQDECVDLDAPMHNGHNRPYKTLGASAHQARMNNKRNRAMAKQQVVTPVKKNETKSDAQIKPIYFVIMAILYFLYRFAQMTHFFN